MLEKAASAQAVLVTAGDLGCSYAFKNLDGEGVLSGFLPVLKVEVEDTTGAGDAFLAGFCFAMLQVTPCQGDSWLCLLLFKNGVKHTVAAYCVIAADSLDCSRSSNTGDANVSIDEQCLGHFCGPVFDGDLATSDRLEGWRLCRRMRRSCEQRWSLPQLAAPSQRHSRVASMHSLPSSKQRSC